MPKYLCRIYRNKTVKLYEACICYSCYTNGVMNNETIYFISASGAADCHSLLRRLLAGKAVASSEKTVRTDLKHTEPLFSDFVLSLMRKPGCGIILSGSRKNMMRLQSYLQEEKAHCFACRFNETRQLHPIQPAALFTYTTHVAVGRGTAHLPKLAVCRFTKGE